MKQKKYIFAKLLSIFGYLALFFHFYFVTNLHNKYYFLNDANEYIYKNITQKGDYEFLIIMYGLIFLCIHIALLIGLVCELIIKKDYPILKEQNTNKLSCILFYIGLVLNICPYITSRFFEILYTEFLIFIGIH
jgi:hypothetical protein